MTEKRRLDPLSRISGRALDVFDFVGHFAKGQGCSPATRKNAARFK
jgi:hypothetical protein